MADNSLAEASAGTTLTIKIGCDFFPLLYRHSKGAGYSKQSLYLSYGCNGRKPHVNTLGCGEMVAFWRWKYWMHFIDLDLIYFHWSFTEICSRVSNQQCTGIGSECGLVSYMLQTVVWITDSLDYCYRRVLCITRPWVSSPSCGNLVTCKQDCDYSNTNMTSGEKKTY